MSAGEKETQAAEEQVASGSILDSMLEAMAKSSRTPTKLKIWLRTSSASRWQVH